MKAMQRSLHKQTRAMVFAAALVLLAGCGVTPPTAGELANTVMELGKANRWADAMPLAKQLVLAYPDAPGGHYLLGKAYLHRPDPQLLHAEGEFETALALFERTQSLDAVLESNADAFALALYRDLALVDFRWIREAMGFNLPPTLIRDKLLEAKANVEKGLKINPQEAFLLEMQTTVHDYLEGPFKNIGAPPKATA